MLAELSNLYQLSKTLRFELKPVGKTLENIRNNDILKNDEQRADDYQQVKQLIDNFHKDFIEWTLRDFILDIDLLRKYETFYSKASRNEKEEKAFDKAKETLRKQLAERFTTRDDYKKLFNKEFIQEILPDYVSQDKKELVNKFNKFVTYFSGFFENRKNIYSADEKSTAIAFRCIHENLPKFLDNIKTFNQIKEVLRENLAQVHNDFKEYLNVLSIDELFCLDYFSITLTQKQIEVYNSVIGGRTTADDHKIQGINEYINLYNQQHKDKKLPLLKPLFKQILSDRDQLSARWDSFKGDKDILDAIADTYEKLQSTLWDTEEEAHSLQSLLSHLHKYDLSGIYIPCTALSLISQKQYSDYGKLKYAILENLKKENPCKSSKRKKESIEEYDARIDKLFKTYKSFSLQYINTVMAAQEDGKTIERYFATMGVTEDEKQDLFTRIREAFIPVASLQVQEGKKLSQNKAAVETIKTFLDAIKDLQHFVKPLLGCGEEADKDNRFYGELLPLWEDLNKITPLYNKVRAYLTQKPYSTEKYKLNFVLP